MKKIRKAVAAIIVQDEEYLMIKKVYNETTGEFIPGYWDIPKGGIKQSDIDVNAALKRELYEETGSNAYRVLKQYPHKIRFQFDQPHPYDGQETTVFLVEYLGDRSELHPADKEIEAIKFVNKQDLLAAIPHQETLYFLKDNAW